MAPTVGQAVQQNFMVYMDFFIVMSVGREIHFGMISSFIKGSAWLCEAPLDMKALPVHGATNFRASS